MNAASIRKVFRSGSGVQRKRDSDETLRTADVNVRIVAVDVTFATQHDPRS